MNLRNAAALALVGWYLMGPPIGPGWHFDRNWQLTERPWVRSQIPLNRWDILKSFDTAKECESFMIDLKEGKATPDPDYPWFDLKDPNDPNDVDTIRDTHLVCIASDDPRLKEK
jgi:hypothetical protein